MPEKSDERERELTEPELEGVQGGTSRPMTPRERWQLRPPLRAAEQGKGPKPQPEDLPE
jgi:hypothetical protein